MSSKSTDKKSTGCGAGNGTEARSLLCPLKRSLVGRSPFARPTPSKRSPINTVQDLPTICVMHTERSNQAMKSKAPDRMIDSAFAPDPARGFIFFLLGSDAYEH